MNLFKSFLLLSLTLLTLTACQSATDQADGTTLKVPAPGEKMVDEMIVVDTSEADVTFVLTGMNFAFSMYGTRAPELRVKKGDLVRIEFTSTNGFHDWTVNEFDAATQQVSANGSTFVEFVADKAGTFEYFCSVSSHRSRGMIGKFIVE